MKNPKPKKKKNTKMHNMITFSKPKSKIIKNKKLKPHQLIRNETKN